MKSVIIEKIVFFAVLVVILLGYGICNRQVQIIRKALPAENLRAETLMVNPELLKIVGGEFKGLLADYLLLKISVFRGGVRQMTQDDWEAMALLFKQSLVLDPYFFQTGYYTQGILVWREGLAAKAIELLEFQAAYRDWDWETKFYVGFDYFYFLKDNNKAAKVMMQAAKLPGAPPIVATLGARLAQRSGQTLTSIVMLKTLYEHTDDEKTKSLLSQRMQAYLGIYKIEQALAEYVKRYGQPPASLDDLVKMKVLEQIPINPSGEIFYYDPETGRVSFDKFR